MCLSVRSRGARASPSARRAPPTAPRLATAGAARPQHATPLSPTAAAPQLPKHINEQRVLDAISIHKDVDGFHPMNIGSLAM